MIKAYRRSHDIEEICSLGEKHKVTCYQVKFLFKTDRTKLYDNGYTVEHTAIYVDNQGREYHHQPPTDFYGGSRFRRIEDSIIFTSKKSKHARNLYGQDL